LLLVLLTLPAVVPAQFTHTTNNGTLTITGYTGQGGAVVIPDTINGLPVTGVGTNAFYQCYSLTSVTIPGSVTSIGDAAFGWCTSLTNATIANGLTSIRDQTFYTCTNLASVTIPNSVTNIGDEAFYACTSLTGLTIPSSVTSIGDGAFAFSWSLTTITIPNSVSSLGGYAFSGCFLLTGAYFLGNAPSADSTVFQNDHATVYYLPGTTGWGSTFGGLPTALWQLPGPAAWTLSATTISATSATLNGTVNPNGSLTAAWFQWGTTTNYGNLTPATGMGGGTSALPLSAPLAGLTPGITYHYRVAATNSNGAGYSTDGSFTTLGPPEVWTLSATAVTATNATLNGTVNPNSSPTTAWFQWGTTTNYGNLTPATGMGSGTNALPLSAPLAGLTLGVTYHFRVAATNSYGTVYGSDQSFAMTTLPPPEVYTLSATAVSATTATLNGTVNPKGYPTGGWFQWGTTTNYANATAATGMGSGTDTLPLSGPLAGLTPRTIYHFRAAATNSLNPVYGGDQSFTTATSPTEFNYTITNGTITITGYTGPGGAVIIPNVINGYPVTAIGESAFISCTRLTSVTIPDSVTSIGHAAFFKCTGLTSLTIPGSVTNIGDSAFDSCAGLASVSIGNSVTSIGVEAFYACTSLTCITIPNSVASIGDWAFDSCDRLTNVSIGINVTSMNSTVFDHSGSLTAITVDALNSTFSSVDGVLFDKSQTTLILCPEGKPGSFIIPDSVTSIRYLAFWLCSSLTNITIPNGVASIGYGTFSQCSSLSSVTVGSGVTNIGNGAFAECPLLTRVYFLGNAPSADLTAFDFDNATVYYLPGTTGWGATFCGLPTALWSQVPTIETQPQTQTAEAGSAVALWAHATNSLPLFYLLYFNHTILLESGTNWQLELTNVQFAQSGAYTVVISNVLGAVTSAPALLNVITPVERRPVPGVKVTGEAGSLLNVDYATSLSPAPNWTTLISVSLTSTSQYYFDLTIPLPPQRYFRAWQTGTPSVLSSLDLHLVPAITVTGNIGGSVRLDYINRFGPIDAWVALDTVTLTNTPQLYFDISAPGQPQRLYRLVPSP
jgi:hypothetical protein